MKIESNFSNRAEMGDDLNNNTLVWMLSSSTMLIPSDAEKSLFTMDNPAINNIYHFMLMSYLGVISVCSFILNGLFIYLTSKYHQFHEAYMYIRKAYAIIDMIFPLMCLVQYLVNFYVQDVPSWLTCSVGYVIVGLFYSTLQFTAYIAIERYFFFCKPFRYQRYFNVQSVSITSIAIVALSQVYVFGRGVFFERKPNPLLMLCTPLNEPLSIVVNILICVIPALTCTLFSAFNILSLMKSLASVQPHGAVQYQVTTESFIRRKAVKKSLK